MELTSRATQWGEQGKRCPGGAQQWDCSACCSVSQGLPTMFFLNDTVVSPEHAVSVLNSSNDTHRSPVAMAMTSECSGPGLVWSELDPMLQLISQ